MVEQQIEVTDGQKKRIIYTSPEKETVPFKEEKKVQRTIRKITERKKNGIIKRLKKLAGVAGFRQAIMREGKRTRRVRRARVRVAKVTRRRIQQLEEQRETGMLGAESPFFVHRETTTEVGDVLTSKRKKKEQPTTFLGKGSI